MLQTTSDQVIYKTRAVGPSTFVKAPLLPTARQLRKRWNQHIQLLGSFFVFFDQSPGRYRLINHAVVVGQLASIQQIKLPPFKVNKLILILEKYLHQPPLRPALQPWQFCWGQLAARSQGNLGFCQRCCARPSLQHLPALPALRGAWL